MDVSAIVPILEQADVATSYLAISVLYIVVHLRILRWLRKVS